MRIDGWCLLLLALGAPALAGTDGRGDRVAGPPGLIGSWSGARNWPVVGIHAMILPTGEVLHYSYDNYNLGIEAAVWDPVRDRFERVDWKPNLFCSGHSLLPDGSVYVTGGLKQEECEVQGIKDTHVFDPWERVWVRLDDMRVPRYYPTNLTLGTGKVLILSGNNAQCFPTPVVEIYEPGKKIQRVRGANKRTVLYPRVHLLPNGRVAHVGPEPDTSVLNPGGGGWSRVARTLLGEHRYEGLSFLIPGNPYEVMICGGFTDFVFEPPEGGMLDGPTATCERIDFSRSPPVWRHAAPMHYPRGHANAVVLPDGRVLVVGGGQHDLYDDAIRNAEIYDASRDEWTLVPSQTYNRAYHSTAVLLPDGQVLSAGSDDHVDEHDHGPGSARWAEIYRPPYLHRGRRPQFRRKMDEVIHYGETFQFRTSQSKRIVAVSLVRPSAATHSINPEQRLIRLKFENVRRNIFEAEVPENPNLLPPGYYMLFLLNDRAVPSVARWVQVLPGEEE